MIRLADVAWSVSGSVSLELMMEALPTVILYKIRPFDLWVARWFIKSKYITLVNLLADAELMPEYLTSVDVSADLARWARTWLDDPLARAGRRPTLPPCATPPPNPAPPAAPPTTSSPGYTTTAAPSLLFRRPPPIAALTSGPSNWSRSKTRASARNIDRANETK